MLYPEKNLLRKTFFIGMNFLKVQERIERVVHKID